ncbi:hypothetical protein [Nonomuraea turcica]|uniref:hypothetical protein n=1 Tax=Nonomuraea sp. G32 TaxID=3067274 RepID=UPI00273B5D4A|nr:hypothetical protein [Nonomuraea sp. G32]MDP4504194.1 hypothetical protein [Nonomuraea sp. G32]
MTGPGDLLGFGDTLEAVHVQRASLAWCIGDTSPLVDNLVRLARDLFRPASQ